TNITDAVYMWRHEGNEYAIRPEQVVPDEFGVFTYGETYALTIIVMGPGGCTYESEPFTLTLNETPQSGAVGNDQSICYGETPAELVSLDGGSGSGTVSYRWEQSADGTAWHIIPDANGVS